MKILNGKVPKKIDIDGTLVDGGRYLIAINNCPLSLRGVSFKYFVVLAYHLKFTSTGWVHAHNIDFGYNQVRYLYRLKSELLAGIDWPWQVFNNDRHCHYQLNADPKSILFNKPNLQEFPDCAVNALLD